MEEIKSLKGVSFETIFNAFQEAFKEYEMQLNKEELLRMLERRGFRPELSFAAFHGDKIVSFTLNGIGFFEGVNTAYDTGSGTIKAYRGKGLATKIFNHSLPSLKQAGVKQYLLEVLQHNDKAVSVYRKIGFEATRELNYFVVNANKIQFNQKELSSNYSVQIIEKSNWEEMKEWWNFHPTWQNSFDAILRKPEDFLVYGVYTEGVLVGYCVFEPISGDITQIAVKPEFRRKGIATVLLKRMVEVNKHENIKLINTDLQCNAVTAFMNAFSVSPAGKQFEMILKL
ncbi:GNAT family N-acetyltransferase [Prolixibacteraceae bacterium JC049]|nr:GNAT family N-acetyltransferase [Prolixibacteraceae bacterium JC049]